MNDFEPAGKLFDRKIEDANGTVVGRVEDLLLDVASGQIEYVLIALRNGEGTHVETVTVPWSLVLAKTRGRQRWRIGVERTVLERLAMERYGR